MITAGSAKSYVTAVEAESCRDLRIGAASVALKQYSPILALSYTQTISPVIMRRAAGAMARSSSAHIRQAGQYVFDRRVLFIHALTPLRRSQPEQADKRVRKALRQNVPSSHLDDCSLNEPRSSRCKRPAPDTSKTKGFVVRTATLWQTW